MKYEFGTIQVHAEITDNIESLSDVTAKYQGIGEEQKEHLYAIFLDNANQEIGDKLIGLGGKDSVQFDFQDITRTVILVNAAAVILVHNHPSSIPEPTQSDIETTEELHETLDILDIQLLDHVIITRKQTHSMKRQRKGPFA